jgi:beta-1,4-mannosyltransferase
VPHVLISTDEPNFTMGLVEGYRSLGWDISVGTANFKIRAAHYDVVHHQWPEEFSGWQIPNPRQIERLEQDLQWWRARSINIFTVHNLYPHNGDGNPAYHQLYSCFYKNCQLISHFSKASHRLVLEEFPSARTAKHIVHNTAPSYEFTLGSQRERGSRRAEMNIGDEEFVMLMLGRLRSWEEIQLLRRAFDLARIPNKRLLMAGKFALNLPRLRKTLVQLRWIWWLKRRRAVVDTRFVPEEEIARFLDSTDVAIVPRLGGLSSGIPSVAMTFGRMVIAPNHGAYPEYFLGTRNLLYQSGSAESLASKLEEAATLDTNAIGRENAVIASKWSWREICRACLNAMRDRADLPREELRVLLA